MLDKVGPDITAAYGQLVGGPHLGADARQDLVAALEWAVCMELPKVSAAGTIHNRMRQHKGYVCRNQAAGLLLLVVNCTPQMWRTPELLSKSLRRGRHCPVQAVDGAHVAGVQGEGAIAACARE
jgi:hypothetical protein